MGGLIQARDLRRAASGSASERARAAREFVGVWHAEIAQHFEDEERMLLPLTDDASLRGRLLEEHRVLRGLASEVEATAAEPEAGLLERTGVLLHDHIRWEERVYFEAVQRERPEALASLAEDAARIERERPGSRARTRLCEPTHETGQPREEQP